VAIFDYGISLKELLSRTFSGRYSQIQARFPEARLGTMFWLDPRSRMVYFSSTLALESILKGSVFLCLCGVKGLLAAFGVVSSKLTLFEH
jgi:hypothetical protein